MNTCSTFSIRRLTALLAVSAAVVGILALSPDAEARKKKRPGGGGRTEPILDAQGATIGGLDNWTTNTRRESRPEFPKVATEPVGWTASYEGWASFFGGDPVQQVPGRSGSAVKGIIQEVDLGNGQKGLVRCDLSAGPYVQETSSQPGVNHGAGVPVSKRHKLVVGSYQFAPARRGDQLSTYVEMHRNGQMIGQGGATTATAQRGWKQFKAPIVYFGAGNPDRCSILIQINHPVRNGFSDAKPGSYYLVDDLAFSGVVGNGTQF